MNAPVFSRRAFRAAPNSELHLFLIAGEPSGDALGANLMRALAGRAGGARFTGVGGPAMEACGLTSLLPLDEIAVMGILPVLKRLPQLIAAIRKIADAVISAKPDLLVIIDSPDLTHRVARRVRRAKPDLPIINYVGPSVWAWRSGRARRMRAYIDHVLALFPFEPAAYGRLGGPDCTYVGHPLVNEVAALRPNAKELRVRDDAPPTLLVMPGSRESEIRRLMPVFGSAVALSNEAHSLQIVLPTLPHLETLVRAEAEKWPLRPHIVTDGGEKYAFMRNARAALVASGTATLELALAGVPMVVAYKVSPVEELTARLMLKIDAIALPNLILGKHAVPELVQGTCMAPDLAAALQPLISGGMKREAQLSAFSELASRMKDDDERPPSKRAADIIETIAFAAREAQSNSSVRRSPAQT